MNRTLKTMITLLLVISALNVTSTVLTSRMTGPDKPPAPAIVGFVVFAILNLIGAFGLSHGSRWARPMIYVSRGLNIVSNILGLGNHADAALLIVGTSTFLLSIVVLVMLIRARREGRLVT
jgi:uncharacterized membrane protein (DUF2068 family)